MHLRTSLRTSSDPDRAFAHVLAPFALLGFAITGGPMGGMRRRLDALGPRLA